MSCTSSNTNLSITLDEIIEGDTWGGLSVQFTTDGIGLDEPMTSVAMIFKNTSGEVGLSLSNGSGITITDAAAWTFAVDQITTFPLAVGVWSWAIRGTNSDGTRLTRVAGIKRVKP